MLLKDSVHVPDLGVFVSALGLIVREGVQALTGLSHSFFVGAPRESNLPLMFSSSTRLFERNGPLPDP